MLTFNGNPCPLKRQENLLQSGISVRNCLHSFSHCWVQSLKCVYNVQRTREDVFCSGNSHLRERESFLRRLPQLFFVSPWLKLGHKSSKNAKYTSISQSLVIDIRTVGAALKPINPILRAQGGDSSPDTQELHGGGFKLFGKANKWMLTWEPSLH